jgi:preprotein translocase subunit SecY
LSNAKTHWLADVAHWMTRFFATTSITYAACYFLLVVLFTYFYTGVIFNTQDIAENMQKQGGFISGIRPGRETAAYLGRVVNRLTLIGSVALGLIAILPFIVQKLTNTQTLTLGGTAGNHEAARKPRDHDQLLELLNNLICLQLVYNIKATNCS